MITKLITTDSYDFGDMAARLVPLHSRGVDSNWLLKTAGFKGAFAKEIEELKPEKGKTVLHIIALGDEETYNCNRNGDAFSRSDNVTAHRSFKDIGHVFRNHKHDDPSKAVGEVLATAHNDRMGRVELLVSLNDKLCPDEVETVNKGEDVPFSMGCFTAGHKLTLDDASTVLLEDCVKGQRVLTHTGEHRRVLEKFHYDYTGELFRLSASALETIEATENHPFYVISREKMATGDRTVFRIDQSLLGDEPDDHAEWARADALQEGDYLLTPVPQYDETNEELTVPLARLLGYYAAEGYVRLTPMGRFCSVGFSINTSDAALEEIPSLCEALGISQDCIAIRKGGASPFCVYIIVTDSKLAYTCASYCGRLAKDKRLSYELLSANKEVQLNFLGTLLNGDGCRGSGSQTGAIYLSTASPFYRDQIRTMLARVGVLPGVNTIKHQAGMGKSTFSTTEYQIYIPKTDAYILHPYTVKGTRTEPSTKRGGARIRWGKYILTPIKSIERRSVINERVYNIEVETDNSYVINNVAVHNSSQEHDVCSHCLNKAPTARDHCDCIKNHLCEVLADGTKIYMKNPNPKYFDISTVHKPADRIAYSLRKVASGKIIGGHELAEMFGLVDSTSTKTATMKALATIYKEIPATARKAAKPDSVRADTMKELKVAAAAHGLENLLNQLSEDGMVLSPTDFSELIGHPCPHCVGPAMEESEGLDDIDDHTEVEAFDKRTDLSKAEFSQSAKEDLTGSCSMEPEPVKARVLKLTITKAAMVKLPISDPIEAQGLTALYKHYKVATAHRNMGNRAIVKAIAATF